MPPGDTVSKSNWVLKCNFSKPFQIEKFDVFFFVTFGNHVRQKSRIFHENEPIKILSNIR